MRGNRKESLVGSLLDCIRHEGSTEVIQKSARVWQLKREGPSEEKVSVRSRSW